MRLYASYAIVILVVSMTGQVGFHQIGSWSSTVAANAKKACEDAIPEAEASMNFEQIWPNGFPPAPSEDKAFFDIAVPKIVSGSAPGACSVASVDMKEAKFYLDGTQLANGTVSPTKMTCNLDTTKFPDGRHTLAALVTFNDGTTTKVLRHLIFKNGTAALPEDLPKPVLVHMGCIRKT